MGVGPEAWAGAGWGEGGSWSHPLSSGTVPFSPPNLGLSRGPPQSPGGGGTQPPRCEESRSQAGVSEAPRWGEDGLDRSP